MISLYFYKYINYFETGSHVAQVWTCYVVKNNLELLTFPSPSLEFWDDRHAPLCPLYAVLRIKSRAFHMLGKPSTSLSLIWWFLLTGPGLGNAKHMGYYLFITITATINQLSHLQLNLYKVQSSSQQSGQPCELDWLSGNLFGCFYSSNSVSSIAFVVKKLNRGGG